MKPPADVRPSDLFLKLSEPEPSEEVDFPRCDQFGKPVGKLRIRVLSQDDHDRARLEGEREMLKRGIKPEELSWPATREVLGDTIAREVLAMSCLTAESQLEDENGRPVYGRVFRNAKDLGKLRPDEIAVLFSYYQMIQAKFGPYESNVDDDDVNAWVARLVQGASQHPLAQVPSQAWPKLVSSLVDRIYSLYALMDSQRSALPNTLASALDDFSSATGLFGERAANSTPTGGGNSLSDTPVTPEAAADLAHAIRGE